MTGTFKGIRVAAWALVALAFAGCASAPEPAREPTRAEVIEPAVPSPATVPDLEPEAPKAPPVLKRNYPKRYTVKAGDTLWGIASRFLRDPWRWPELWQKNPQVANPHLIYVGDVLTLTYVDGKPTLQVQRPREPGVVTPPPPAPAPAPAPPPERVAPPPVAPPVEIPTNRPYPTVKVSPRIRAEDLAKAIPTIPLDMISAFLSRPRIVSEKELERAPYIFSSVDEHLIAGADNRIYVQGLEASDNTDYVVVRKGKVYMNPDDDGDVLGFEAIHVADARLTRMGRPATFRLVRTNREVLNGDRLLPADDGFIQQNFMPHPPKEFIDGTIIAVQGGVTQIGQYMVVVIDRGTEAGLDVGTVMGIYQASSRARDNIAGEEVRLPRERAGTLMLFRTFERLSYALVMDATRPIHIYDAVTNP